MDLPEHHQHVIPYLIVADPDALHRFMVDVLGGRETAMHRTAEGALMHGEVVIGGSTVMFSPSTPQWPVQVAGLFVYVPDADAAYARALAGGATSVLPMRDEPYGRTGGVVDTNGVTWWITTPPHPSR